MLPTDTILVLRVHVQNRDSLLVATGRAHESVLVLQEGRRRIVGAGLNSTGTLEVVAEIYTCGKAVPEIVHPSGPTVYYCTAWRDELYRFPDNQFTYITNTSRLFAKSPCHTQS